MAVEDGSGADVLSFEHLRHKVGPATESQIKMAALAGKSLSAKTPQVVAAALLRVWLADELAIRRSRRADEFVLQRLNEVANGRWFPPAASDTIEEIEACIDYCYLVRRIDALDALKLRRGDVVRRIDSGVSELEAVSSIGGDGAVFLRGAGARAWPDMISLVASVTDGSPPAVEARRIAANRAAERTRESWSLRKESELAAWLVEDNATEEDLEGLRMVIEGASDEKPIQLFLQERPRLLASILRGPTRYVISQARLSVHYRPDFMIADVDSTGIRWVFVELETPASGLALENKQGLDKSARAGLQQVETWREWTMNNLDHARRSRRSDGLGLFGIRPGDDGLVLVGRRKLLRDGHEALRRKIWESQRVHIRTYDWLLETIRGAVTFNGVPAANRFLLPRPEDESKGFPW